VPFLLSLYLLTHATRSRYSNCVKLNMIRTDLLYEYYHGQFETIWTFNGSLSHVPRNTVYPYLVGRGASHILNALSTKWSRSLSMHERATRLQTSSTEIILTFSGKQSCCLLKMVENGASRRPNSGWTRKWTANAAPWAPVGMLCEGAHGAAFASQVLVSHRLGCLWNSVLRKLLNKCTNNSTK
jgi:hypothetical protein